MTKFLLSTLVVTLCLIASCSKDEEEEKREDNVQTTGTSANDFLSGEKFDKITVEVIAVDGFELSSSQISSFKSFTESLVNKSEGISINQTIIDSPEKSPYTASDLRDYEDEIRTKFNDGSELALFVYIAEGAYTNNNVLGVAYRNTSFALFGGRIDELTGGIGQPSEDLVVQTVLRHELGHLLGLVDNGTPLQSDHHDEENGSHCDVEACLMYYAVETGDFLSNLIGASAPPELDAQCKADLKANGGK